MATRNEQVRLDLTGNFTTEMAAAAAATAWLNRELRDLNGASSNARPGAQAFQRDLRSTEQQAQRTSSSINQLTGRLGLFADAVTILGPGVVPIAAVGVAALGGIATAAAAIGVAGASAIAAFQGLGDAVKAVDDYQADKTVANLEKAQEAMGKLGPDAQAFVSEFQKVQPLLTDIRDAAASGLYPGLTDALTHFDELAPRIERIFQTTGDASGDIVSNAVESLASPRWSEFMDFLEVEMPAALSSIARTMGDLSHGLGEMLMVADPTNDRFLGWLEDVAQGFDRWATSAEGQDSISGLLEYATQNGPEVAALFTSLLGTLSAIVQAAAPLGGPVLEGLTAISDLIRVIADSDLATPFLTAIAAMRIYTRVAAIAASTQSRLRFAGPASSTVAGPGITRAGAGALNNIQTDPRFLNYGAYSPLGAAGYDPYRGGYQNHLQAALVAPRASDVRRAEAAARAQRRMQIAGGAGAALGVGLLASGAADEIGATNTAMLTLTGTMAGPYGAAAGAVVGTFLDIRANAEQTEQTLGQFNDVLASGSTNLADYVTAAQQMRDKSDSYLSNFDDVGSTVGFLGTNPSETYSLFGDALDGNIDRLSSYSDAAAKADATTDQIGRNFLQIAEALGETEPITAADLMSPDVDRVQGIIDGLAPSLARMGITLEDVANMTPTELDAFVDDLNSMNGQLYESNDLLRGFTASLAAAQEYLTGRNEVRDYEAAIDAATAALKENGRTLDENTPKGRDNAAALDSLATAGLAMADGMKDGSARQKGFLRGLKAQLTETAGAFGMNRRQIATFLDGLNLVDTRAQRARRSLNTLPKDVRTKILTEGVPKTMGQVDDLVRQYKLTEKERRALIRLMNAEKTKADARALAAVLDAAARNRQSTITITTINRRRTLGAAGVGPERFNESGKASADGSTVPKTGLPYADRHPYLLADGEEVISNRFGQADRHRDLLKAINAGRAADGATIGYNRFAGFSAAPTRDVGWGAASRGLKELRRALDESTSALQRETTQRQAAIDTVRSNFTNDPFAKPDDIWSSQGADPISSLTGDIGNLNQYQALIKKLGRRGLNGGALLEADTLEEAQALGEMSRPELRRYERLYNQRQRLATRVGGSYADAAGFTKSDIEGLRRDVRSVKQAIKQAEKANEKGHAQTSASVAHGLGGSARRAAQRRRNQTP